jgi:hypothetical protein
LRPIPRLKIAFFGRRTFALRAALGASIYARWEGGRAVGMY